MIMPKITITKKGRQVFEELGLTATQQSDASTIEILEQSKQLADNLSIHAQDSTNISKRIVGRNHAILRSKFDSALGIIKEKKKNHGRNIDQIIAFESEM